jgi:hypothetical protein
VKFSVIVIDRLTGKGIKKQNKLEYMKINKQLAYKEPPEEHKTGNKKIRK